MPIPEKINADNGIVITITIPASTEVKSKKKPVKKVRKKKGPVLGSEGWLDAWQGVWKQINKRDAKFIAGLCKKVGITTFMKEIPTYEEMVSNFSDLKSVAERSDDPAKLFKLEELKGILVLLERYKKPLLSRLGKKRYSDLYDYFKQLFIAAKRRSGKLKIVKVRNIKLPGGGDSIQIILEGNDKSQTGVRE